MPADEFILTVYDPGAGVLEVVATADQSGGMVGTGAGGGEGEDGTGVSWA